MIKIPSTNSRFLSITFQNKHLILPSTDLVKGKFGSWIEGVRVLGGVGKDLGDWEYFST